MYRSIVRFATYAQNVTKWQISQRFNCNYCTRSRNISADATAAVSTSQGKIKEIKEPVGTQQLQELYDKEVQNNGVVPVFKRALLYGNKIAIRDNTGEFSYRQVLDGAQKLAQQLLVCGNTQTKVAFLCSNSAVYTVVQWACWISGQIAVPLSSRHPADLLKYYIKDSDAQVIVTVPEYESKVKPLAESLGRTIIVIDHSFIPKEADYDSNVAKEYNVLDLNQAFSNGEFYKNKNALILYTSGSTGPPKGTVISHKNIQAQALCLAEAWQINKEDSILHVLPLNHVHGCVNALLCPLSVGAKVSMQSQFDPAAVWSALLNVNAPSRDRINLFMAVPTIYSFLIAEYEKAFSKNERMIEYIRVQCEKKIRLMVSGSAPLPVSVFETWKRITGHKLLERYGMTEIGMALSNPYIIDAIRDRVPGSVGGPLPGTEVKLVNDNQVVCQVKGESGKGLWSKSVVPINIKVTSSASTKNEDLSGELYVKGPSVFLEYYKKPDETKNAFENGWFKTGDVAKYENGVFKILGRNNVDIIKTGAYKVSALEIETHLLEHPLIADVCIVGVPDTTWGQKIAALIVCKENDKLTLPELQQWCEERIASYQIPSIIKIMDELPRNAMGKINKKEIVRDYFSNASG